MEKTVKRKSGMATKGLKINTRKIKVPFELTRIDSKEEKGKWSCSAIS